MGADQSIKRLGQRLVVYPAFRDMLDAVLASGDPSADPDDECWRAYQLILQQCENVSEHPVIIPESDPRLDSWPETFGKHEEWMFTTQSIAVANYQLVPEDGPEFSSSDSMNSDPNDRGDVLKNMYTVDTIGPNGKPDLIKAAMPPRLQAALSLQMKATVSTDRKTIKLSRIQGKDGRRPRDPERVEEKREE
jgi:hypothetical protein